MLYNEDIVMFLDNCHLPLVWIILVWNSF